MEQSAIADFYKGRTVFITGGTGFMGKVLVEKLLRSCPEIERIYLLMRPAKGQSVDTRLQDLIQNQVKNSNIIPKKLCNTRTPTILKYLVFLAMVKKSELYLVTRDIECNSRKSQIFILDI